MPIKRTQPGVRGDAHRVAVGHLDDLVRLGGRGRRDRSRHGDVATGSRGRLAASITTPLSEASSKFTGRPSRTEHGAGEVGAREDGAAQVSAAEGRVAQVGVRQAGALEVSVDEIRALQVGALAIGPRTERGVREAGRPCITAWSRSTPFISAPDRSARGSCALSSRAPTSRAPTSLVARNVASVSVASPRSAPLVLAREVKLAERLGAQVRRTQIVLRPDREAQRLPVGDRLLALLVLVL